MTIQRQLITIIKSIKKLIKIIENYFKIIIQTDKKLIIIIIIIIIIRRRRIIIVLLFILNNSQFKKQAKTCLPLSIIRDSACLSASLGDEGLLSSANIPQIADVVPGVVFLLFLLCFQPIVYLFLPRETSKMFRCFVLTTKTTQSRPKVFSVNCSISWKFCCTSDDIFHMSQNSSQFGRQ